MPYISPQDRNQLQIFNTLEEQIEGNNPVRIIDALVERILKENQEMIEQDGETGRPRYHDSTMQKIMLYAYLHRLRSSRTIERECRLNCEMKWLTGNLVPDHWTIANYRVKSAEKIKKLTKLFRRFLKDQGYINCQVIAIDGTKIKANAKRDMLSAEKLTKRLNRIEEEIDKYLEELRAADSVEDREDAEITGTEEKDPLMEKIEKTTKQCAEIHEILDEMKLREKNYVSVSDWDANMMKTRNGKMAAYNAQIAVDEEHKMIADSEVITENTDTHQVGPMLHSIKEELGEVPINAVMDKGYMVAENIEKTEEEFKASGTPVNIVVAGYEKQEEKIKLTYSPEEDAYYCSENQKLKLLSRNVKKRASRADVYQGVSCDGCLRRGECTTAKKGRIHYRYHNKQWKDEYAEKISTPESVALIKKRKSLSEHPNGTLKWMMGQAQFVLRGLEKVTIEVNLLATCYNLKRLLNISPFELIMAQIRGYKWQIQ